MRPRTKEERDAILARDEQLTRGFVARTERRLAENIQLRAKIDRIQRARRQGVRTNEALSAEEICFLLWNKTIVMEDH